MVRRVIILGSTGSIGRQTLEVIEHLNALHARGEAPARYEVVGLAAGNNVRLLDEQSRRYPSAELAISHVDVRDLAIGEQGLGARFSGRLLNARHHGLDAPERLVRETPCDIVVAAIVGIAGLPATLAAVELGRDVALANKETLVAAGSLVAACARRTGSRLLPVDSEHAGVWECLAGVDDAPPPMTAPACVQRVILTASGGPFRSHSREAIERATPAMALAHPTWRMGPKVTIDCASLMNKGLELIEAHWLFGLSADRLGVLVHPQSIVHAIVELSDGSSLAQLGAPDMRTPIACALAWPERIAAGVAPVDFTALGALEFRPVDEARFPCVRLAFAAIRRGGTAPAILNAANEVAVASFLAGRLAFTAIAPVIENVLAACAVQPLDSLATAWRADREAREAAAGEVARLGR